MHRKLAGGDIYWINNRNGRVEDVDARFRFEGKLAVIWHAETGKTEAVSYNIANGITKVNVHLTPNDVVFVLFKDKATQTSLTLPATIEKQLLTVEGNWNVSFQKDRGAPASATFDKLVSYTENSDAGIKYFSGTVSYTKTITADKSWFANHAQYG